MTQGAKIGLIVGGISVVGVAVWLIIKNRNQQAYVPPYTPPNNVDYNNGKPAINWGALATTIIDSLPQNIRVNKDQNNQVVSVEQPSTKTSPGNLLFVNSAQYNSNEIKSMQNYLIGIGGQPKMWVQSTGGADGKIGNGFKSAYTWAVLNRKVLDIQDLYNKSGAKK